MASFTLYPGRAYIEIKGQLYNRTPLPQTFLWWANPAVAVNDYTQSVFPPDVHAVMDHGKRDVSKFPIATGVYYKHDYGAGVDISRYKNIPVPTSYMAYHSDFDFVGGYDDREQAGVLHVADHHVSPGKKQWTWGCGDFGQAWDRNLTDENGPYIELMTGMFTDNQPDFTWLKPFEEKVFTQYFMPYKKAANVKNATTEAVMNLEVTKGVASVCVYTTAVYENAKITLHADGKAVYEKVCTLSPVKVLTEQIDIGEAKEQTITLRLYDANGREMLSYIPAEPKVEKLPQAATALPSPKELATTEELYLAGTHLEQYRHATFAPEDYYQEALRREPQDMRCNNAYGLLLLRRGLFKESELYFKAAVKRATWKNPNPYDSEPYFNLGLSLYYQHCTKEAFDAFFKATWTSAQQEMAYYYLAALAAQNKEYPQAMEYIERSLVKNAHNLKACALKAILLRKIGRKEEAKRVCLDTISIDPFAYGCAIELALHYGSDIAEALKKMRSNASAFIETATDFAEAGCTDIAIQVLQMCKAQSPMLKYYEAYFTAALGGMPDALLAEAVRRSPLYCFPNKLEDIAVLQFACEHNPLDGKAPYYLGNLYYDKRQYSRAQQLWEQSAGIDVSFPTVWRNLALVYYNKSAQPEKALQALEKAYVLDKSDARVFLELDQLYKKTGRSPAERLQNYEQHHDVFVQRDDLITEYVTLLNLTGKYSNAHAVTMNHKFHPWEGGEGKITSQYALSLREMAKQALELGETEKAQKLLKAALVFPHNLGEGKLEGAKDNDTYYYLGLCANALGNTQEATACFARAATGTEEPAGMMYYNDQPADMILYQGLALREMGNEQAARARFHTLVDYGEVHLFDNVTIDYFAVSLPDLALFDEDLHTRNVAHCNYLIALGSYGLGEMARAKEACIQTLAINKAHTGAAIHLKLLAD